jgi:hypothetical protein
MMRDVRLAIPWWYVIIIVILTVVVVLMLQCKECKDCKMGICKRHRLDALHASHILRHHSPRTVGANYY